ncbi:hypothetical protein PG994_001411 [Apiospora phragmitis]|uniref:Uncharacterized protein n=1 Tax=Apiospora phragmitis TaxID=2905665 RepID=A0ABR1WTF5_9PEZI
MSLEKEHFTVNQFVRIDGVAESEIVLTGYRQACPSFSIYSRDYHTSRKTLHHLELANGNWLRIVTDQYF